MDHEAITGRVIGAAMRVHGALGPGFVERVYQNALAVELRDAGLNVACERPLEVRYRGVIVGEFVADMVVAECVLVENKAVRAVAPAHEVQVVNYLTATGLDVGLLINFGASSLQFRRLTRVYVPGGRREAGEQPGRDLRD